VWRPVLRWQACARPLNAVILWWLLILLYNGVVWWLLMRMLRQRSQVARFLRVFKPPREVPTNFSTS